MPKKDYIPYSDAEFDEWFRNFAANIGPIATRLEMPPALISAVIDAYANWRPGYAAQQTARNAAQAATAIKDELRDAGKEAVRPLVGIMQANRDLTDGERATMRITVPDRTLTQASPDYVANLAPPLLLLDWSGRGLVPRHRRTMWLIWHRLCYCWTGPGAGWWWFISASIREMKRITASRWGFSARKSGAGRMARTGNMWRLIPTAPIRTIFLSPNRSAWNTGLSG